MSGYFGGNGTERPLAGLGLMDADSPTGEMAAFDALPPPVRAALREMPADLLATSLLDEVRRVGVGGVMVALRDVRSRLELAMREEMAEACAR